MKTIRFEHTPPDEMYQINSARQYAAAVIDAQETVPERSCTMPVIPVRCFVARDSAGEQWTAVPEVDIGRSMSAAQMYKQWTAVYNHWNANNRPVLTLVR